VIAEWQADVVVDSQGGLRCPALAIDLPAADAAGLDPMSALSSGPPLADLVRVRFSRRDAAHVLGSALSARSLTPLRRALGARSQRRVVGPAFWRWVVVIAGATVRPTTGVGLFALSVGLGAGLLVGDLATPLLAVVWGVGLFACCHFAHELAHLVALRLLLRSRTVGGVGVGLMTSFVTGPPVGGLVGVAVATAGPLVGAAVALVLLPVFGSHGHGWLCWAAAFVHLSNLSVVAPDGQALRQALRTRRRVLPGAADRAEAAAERPWAPR
jgi:hypothetical protein